MIKYWLIADLHFGHNNIIKYCNRPFKDVDEMDNAIVNNWNSVVNDKDLVYVLGDVSFYGKEKTKELISRLKGYKLLVIGNHDRRKTKTWWHDVGFNFVFDEPIEVYGYVLSHEPFVEKEHLYNDLNNIHAHLHNDEHRYKTGELHKNKYKCVSAELFDYTPIEFDKLVKKW